MQKQALDFSADPGTVLRHLAGGAAVGGGTMALLNLVRLVREMNEERKSRLEPTETDKNTIVLTLPRKLAEHIATNLNNPPGKSDNVMVKRVTMITSGKRKLNGKGHTPNSEKDGTFAKCSAVGWPTLTLSTLALGGGALAGGALVNKIFEMRKERMLKDELEAAKQEYLDKLQINAAGGFKQSEWLNQFQVPGHEKTAAGPETYSYLDLPLSALAVMLLAGTGGSAYITKRILDEKSRQLEPSRKHIPKVQRIVFKSAPKTTEEEIEESKKAEADESLTQTDMACIFASLGVMMDKLSSESRILNTPYVKAAMVEAKTNPRGLFNKATAIDELRSYLEQNPNLRNMIVRATMEQHPIARHFAWASKLPVVGGLMDKKFWNQFNQQFSPVAKTAALGDIASSVIGNTIASTTTADDLARAIVAAQRADKMQGEDSEDAPNREIDIAASDPEAEAFVAANQEKIQAILAKLMAAKKI